MAHDNMDADVWAVFIRNRFPCAKPKERRCLEHFVVWMSFNGVRPFWRLDTECRSDESVVGICCVADPTWLATTGLSKEAALEEMRKRHGALMLLVSYAVMKSLGYDSAESRCYWAIHEEPAPELCKATVQAGADA